MNNTTYPQENQIVKISTTVGELKAKFTIVRTHTNEYKYFDTKGFEENKHHTFFIPSEIIFWESI